MKKSPTESTIIFASGNAHKYEECCAILEGVPFSFLRDYGMPQDAPENGHSFFENALAKAQYYHAELVQSGITPCAVLAEDSGICVDVLNGDPGIYSARYGFEKPRMVIKNTGGQIVTPDNPLYQCVFLQTEIATAIKKQTGSSHASKNCAAHLTCCAVLLTSSKKYSCEYVCVQSEWHGSIIKNNPTGSNGFGYDPVFFVPEYNCTSAQLTDREKHKLSHRGKALRALAPHIAAILNP